MSTSERKARKAAGIKFTRTAKTVTPFEDRNIPVVTKKSALGLTQGPSNRAIKKLKGYIEASGTQAPADPSQDEDAKPTKPKAKK